MNLIDLYPDIYSNPGKWSGKRWDFYSDEELTEFTATAVNSGTIAVIDTASEGNYGVCRISGAATTDDSGGNLQCDAYCYALRPNRTTLFSAKIQNVADMTQCDLAAGLIVSDTSIIAGTATGVFFRKDDGDLLLDLFGETNDVTVVQQAALMSVANATEYVATLRFVGGEVASSGTLYAYVNGTLLATVTATTWPTHATYALSPSAAFQSGNATGTHACDLDFIEAWISRVKVG